METSDWAAEMSGMVLFLLRSFYFYGKVVYLLPITHGETYGHVNSHLSGPQMCLVISQRERERQMVHIRVEVPSLPPVGNPS